MLEEREPSYETIEEISRKIAEIDDKISLQLNEILHHPEFRSLEATWRGLHYLVERGALGPKLKVKILNSGKRDLLKDFDRALEVEDSTIYKKIFSEVYKEGWQIPFGLLVGAYEFSHDPQDVAILENMAAVAAAAHAPFIAGVSPAMFACESFVELGEMQAVTETFKLPEFTRWNNFRKSAKSRYVGLCLPYILLRADCVTAKTFKFKERTEKRDCLWGNAAFAFAGCVLRAYAEKSWLGKMRGTRTDGEVKGLSFQHTAQNINGEKHETALDAKLEHHLPELTRLGFMTLLNEPSANPYFFNSQSVFESPVYDTEAANTTAQLHAQLENILAASRFAVYLMSLWRDRSHLFNTLEDKRNYLKNWLYRYYQDDYGVAERGKAQHLIGEFYPDLREIPGQPGHYLCVLFIRPVYLLDDIKIAMRLELTLSSPYSDSR